VIKRNVLEQENSYWFGFFSSVAKFNIDNNKKTTNDEFFQVFVYSSLFSSMEE